MVKKLSIFVLLFSLVQSLNGMYDIIIYSATPAGISTAITAARALSSLKIAIIEPTAYIGGMLTAGGIGLADIGLIDTSNLFILSKFKLFYIVLL